MDKTIENLKKLKSFHNGSYGADIDKAIKLLEQEPCEDCISRAFLIDRVLEKVKTHRSTIEICDKLIPLIKDLPSVQPKPKTGHWIDTEESSISVKGHRHVLHEVICSECNGISYFKGMSGKYIGANICPNCGVRMQAESEE